jgi:hypothetical protein
VELIWIFSSVLSLPVIITVAVVALVIRARAHDDPEADPGIGTVRRLFLYGLLLVALVFAAVGVALLVGGALDAATGDLVIEDNRTQLAVALAFATVGIPAWAILAAVAQRTLRAHPVESRSQARRLYLNLARGIAIVIVLINAAIVGRVLVGVEEFTGGPVGWLLAWAAAWLIHDRIAAAERAETVTTRFLDRLYAYFAAVLGLGALLGGAVFSLIAPLDAIYERVFRDGLVSPDWSEQWRTASVVAILGAAIWGWHWLYGLARRDAGTTFWRVYLFLFGVLIGVAMVVISAGVMLGATLNWLISEPGVSLSEHFAFLPGPLSALVVGLGSWIYHRVVLMEAATSGARSEPERIYRYILAAVGLVALAIALVVLLALLIDVLTGDTDLVRSETWWRDQLAGALTLLLVGAPLWGYHWYRTQQAVEVGGTVERTATSRRVYVFAVLGAAMLTLLINLVIMLFQFFEAILETEFNRIVVHDARWSIALVLTAGGIAVYHWLILREDQRALPPPVDEGAAAPITPEAPAAEERRAAPREVTIIAARGEDLATALRSTPGIRVRTWNRTDLTPGEPLTGGQIADLRAAILASEHDRVVLILGNGVYELVPYEEAD